MISHLTYQITLTTPNKNSVLERMREITSDMRESVR